jgi:hypothetical protein
VADSRLYSTQLLPRSEFSHFGCMGAAATKGISIPRSRCSGFVRAAVEKARTERKRDALSARPATRRRKCINLRNDRLAAVGGDYAGWKKERLREICSASRQARSTSKGLCCTKEAHTIVEPIKSTDFIYFV